jgi:hypothetical protein
MATYQNVGQINSSNINNNNNNLSTTLNRDSYDYSSTKHNQSSNSKSSTMPKHFYQNTTKTNKRDLVSSENGTDYLTPSDNDLTTNSNETSKRMNNTNGKFSIQKMIRQGFSSWRTKRKPTPSLSTPPPSSISTNLSTPPPLIPSSAGCNMTTDNDLSQVHPSTTVRSLSIDSVSNQTPPQRIIVTEQIAPSSAKSNNVDSVTVDFDRPATNVRGYIQSPWANSSTSTTTTSNNNNTNPTETITRSAPLPTNRTLPVQFSENTKTSETINSTTPLTIPSSNLPKIPPPGMYNLFSFSSIDYDLFILVAPKPDINRLTPIRSNYFNNNNTTSTVIPSPISSSSTVNSSLFSPLLTSNTNEERHVAFAEKLISNQFKPIDDSTTDNNIIYTNLNSSATTLKDKFQSRNSPVNNNINSSSPPTSILNSNNEKTNINISSSSPSTNSSSTPTIQTTKQSIIQDIDTTKYEEIPAKEPDLSRQPEKSALKKPNGVKRRVIPVLRENQRPSPRPSPKLTPNILVTPSPTTKDDEQNEDFDENSSSDEENNEPTKRFANVKRNDSLARFLKDRPLPDELYDKHILVKPLDERKNERENIENKLERKLSIRPRPEELEARNILRAKTQAELIAEKEEKKRYLIRKLSFRPSIQGKKN